jgi:hypothetical protein
MLALLSVQVSVGASGRDTPAQPPTSFDPA